MGRRRKNHRGKAQARRQRGYLEQQWRSARRGMRPNRVTARFFSGGRHQTWTGIVRAPVRKRTKTITPKQGRKLHQKRMAGERRTRTKVQAAQRRQRTADQRGARAQARRQNPPARKPRPGPIALNPRTGRPITWAEAKSGSNRANWQVERIEAELAGRPAPPEPGARRAAAPKPELPPLQAAIEEAKRAPEVRARARKKRAQQQTRQRREREAAQRTVRRKKQLSERAVRGEREKKRRTARRRALTRPQLSQVVAAGVERLLPERARLTAPVSGRTSPAPQAPGQPAGRPNPQPGTAAARRTKRKGTYGAIMSRRCACGGTGRITIYDKDGNPHGSASCPRHGRSGTVRGAKRWTTRGAIRESGLPGLATWLSKRRTRQRGNSDKRQTSARAQALSRPRYAGPTLKCKGKFCQDGISDHPATTRLREDYITNARITAGNAIAAARAHNEQVEADGKGRKKRVPQIPTRRQLEKAARRAYPHQLCKSCGGLGVVPTTLRITRSGQQPAAEWRGTANLKAGRKLTARERSTGKVPTKSAVQVEKRRRLPRL